MAITMGLNTAYKCMCQVSYNATMGHVNCMKTCDAKILVVGLLGATPRGLGAYIVLIGSLSHLLSTPNKQTPLQDVCMKTNSMALVV